MEVTGREGLAVKLFSDTMECDSGWVYEGYWLACGGKLKCV